VLVKFHIAVVVGGLLAGIPAAAAQQGPLQGPDPVLQGPAPPVACAGALDGPDYVPGLDANGQAVPRADIGAERVPVPGELLVPLPNRPAFTPGRGRGRGMSERPYLVLDGKRVERLVNPEPACPADAR
jgi:hypothetical protein